ncbi:hypothetical protein [Rhizobium mesoamericanum]|uniref:Uncharacterized protein n=1 Tax=Rhizobium mesoamericanum STM3625 TaxID=1211777 RepID=K0Q036_9HYPH|nr:hypothetical protein [Rhizobium mesoamericanum]CCM77187.1 conserved hypothetical protein [Rhizobium mesoamericanum STM3625]
MSTLVETELQMVERHVRRGEVIIAQQRLLVARLTESGRSTADEANLLNVFQDIQVQHLLHLARLKK